MILYCLEINPTLISSSSLSPGLPVEQTGEGRLQSAPHQLLSSDHRRTDAEHHHVQAGQEAQGPVWASVGEENGTWVPHRYHSEDTLTHGVSSWSGVMYLQAFVRDE